MYHTEIKSELIWWFQLIDSEKEDNLKKLFSQFKTFVENTYNFQFKKENLKVENFCSANTSETEKENIKKALVIITKLF